MSNNQSEFPIKFTQESTPADKDLIELQTSCSLFCLDKKQNFTRKFRFLVQRTRIIEENVILSISMHRLLEGRCVIQWFETVEFLTEWFQGLHKYLLKKRIIRLIWSCLVMHFLTWWWIIYSFIVYLCFKWGVCKIRFFFSLLLFSHGICEYSYILIMNGFFLELWITQWNTPSAVRMIQRVFSAR